MVAAKSTIGPPDKIAMLTINDLSIQFGDKHLFKNVSARLDGRERIGLVG